MTFKYSQSFIDDYISKKPRKFGVTVTLKPAIKMISLKKLNLNYPLLSRKTVPLGRYFSITAVFNE